MRDVATSIFYLKPFARIYEEHPILSFSLSSRPPLPPLLLFIHTSISSPYFSILLVPRLEPPLFPRQHRIRSKFSYILFTAFLLILLPSEEYSRGNLFNRPRVTYVSLIQIIQNTRHRRKIRIFNEKLEVRQSRCSGINEKLTEQSAPPTDYFS